MQRRKAILTAYRLLQAICLPVLPIAGAYCMMRKKYRRQFLHRMGFRLPALHDSGPRIWIHAMSLGEYNAARPLIQALSSSFPDASIIVSASTRTGLDAAWKDPLNRDHAVTAMPYDLFFATRKAASRLRPDCFILVETDLWPGFLWDLKSRGCRLLLANGSISSRSAERLKRLPALGSLVFGPFERLCMQSRDDAQRLEGLGIPPEKIEVPGSLKAEAGMVRLSNRQRQRLLAETGFSEQSIVVCAGSTHAPEERLLLETLVRLRRSHGDLRMIVAPRDIERGKAVRQLCDGFGLSCWRRSRGAPSVGPDVFILDTLGELSMFYGICHLAFVGGSLADIGGHNVLEPVHLGKPVIFGPSVESCREAASSLVEEGAGFMVKDRQELERALERLMPGTVRYAEAVRAARRFGGSLGGVSSRYVEIVRGLLERDADPETG